MRALKGSAFKWILFFLGVLTLLATVNQEPLQTLAQTRPTLYWGSPYKAHVYDVQARLKQWGYYDGPIDGIYGAQTYAAVRLFQSRNGLRVDGIVGPQTWQALGFPVGRGGTAARPQATTASTGAVSRRDDLSLLARVVNGEAEAEPYIGKVAVAAVILNRVEDPRFPNSLAGVIYQPFAFESVSNGLIWRRSPTSESVRAARDALNGWDPTYGAIYFWNPAKPVNPWVWSRQIVARIGNHVFAR
ncbi:MAG: spore cortex-lytic enzyme [Firmicutes bacterium]|nr:spore cortex-lytic enzyme [Bacillota bacterium]